MNLSPSMNAESTFLLAAVKMGQLVSAKRTFSFFNKRDAIDLADIVSSLIDTLEKLEMYLREAGR